MRGWQLVTADVKEKSGGEKLRYDSGTVMNVMMTAASALQKL